MEMRRGVVLDLDGVLIDGLPFHIEAWKCAFRESGLDVADSELLILEGVESGNVVDAICATRGVKISLAEKLRIIQKKWKVYETLFTVVPIPGSVALVHRLHEYRYGLVLVTGTSQNSAERTVRELGLQECIPKIVSSESVQRGKPFPEPYLRALSILRVPAAGVIAVENAPPGIDSAKSAGLRCLAVATYLDLIHLSAADRIFGSIMECAIWFQAEYGQSSGSGDWRI